MTSGKIRLKRAILPLAIFILVLSIHLAWYYFFPEEDPAQDRWVTVATPVGGWLNQYIENQSYFIGYAYGLSLAFASVALRRYREKRQCSARNMAIGGISFSGFFALAGCYLLGCCGSPMLAVYASFFGAAFLPFAKPLVAGFTTITIAAAYIWLRRKSC